MSRFCSGYSSDTDAICLHLALESGSYRNVWAVVLLVKADQDASESLFASCVQKVF